MSVNSRNCVAVIKIGSLNTLCQIKSRRLNSSYANRNSITIMITVFLQRIWSFKP
jgi:hypothetical protein